MAESGSSLTPAFASPPRGVRWVVLAAVLWSSGGLFIKLAPASGLAVAFARALVTSVFYLLVLRPDLRRAHVGTALAYAGMIVTFVTATKLTTAANAIFLQYTGPAYVLLLGPWLLRERFHWQDAVTVAVSLLGMGLFFIEPGLVHPEGGAFWGNVLGVLSGLTFALAVIGMRHAASGEGGDALPSITLGNLIAVFGLLPFVFRELPHLATPSALGLFLYLGVVQMGLAYLAFDRGLHTLPAVAASRVSMLEPVLNPLWVFLGTGERPSHWALWGGAIVVGAVAVRSWTVSRGLSPVAAAPEAP